MRVAPALVLLVACGEDPLTAVDVRIDADACTAAGAERLRVRVLDAEGDEVELFEVDVAGDDAEVTFPTGVRVFPRGGDAGRRWVVEATVVDAGSNPIAYQRARGGYVRDEIGATDLLFDDACLGIECPTGETCVEARCVPDDAPATRARHTPRTICPPLVFVDAASGTDADGCGDWDGPCATIQRAIDDWLTPDGIGGVIHVHGGSTYTGDTNAVAAIVPERALGAPAAPLVIRAWPGTGMPLLDARGSSGSGIVMYSAYVVLDGLRITRAIRHGITVNQIPAHDLTVRRCELFENGVGTSMFDNHSNIEINNGASNILIEDSILRNAVRPAMTSTGSPASHGDGIYMNAGSDLIVRRSVIDANAAFGIFINGAPDIVVEDTVVNDSGNDGIRIDAQGPIRLAGLRICGNSQSGVDITDAEQLVLSHLSVVDNDGRGITLTGAGPITHQGNLIASNEAVGVEIATDAMVDDGWNLYFMNVTDISGFVPERPETDVRSDPLLIGVDACDLGLEAGSPARGAGPDGTNIGAR